MNIIKYIPIVGVILWTSCVAPQSVLTDTLAKAQGLEYISSVDVDWSSMTKDASARICNIQALDYSPKNNALYLLQSDPAMLGDQLYYTLKFDKSKSQFQKITTTNILSQNGQRIINVLEYQQVLDKGKRPRFNVPYYIDMVYDDVNNTPIVLNYGTYWDYKNEQYSTEPSVHTLSEDNRLLGMYALNRMFRPKFDSLLKDVQVATMTMSPSQEKLFTMTAVPLPGEKPSLDSYDTGFVRVSKYRSSSRSEESQYLYPLNLPNDPSVIGRSDMDWQVVNALAVNDSVLWVIEGLELQDQTWDYNLYEVVLRMQDRLTSSKPISELKRRPVVLKKKLAHLNAVIPEFSGRIKDISLGPIVAKKQTIFLLKANECSDEVAVEILKLSVK